MIEDFLKNEMEKLVDELHGNNKNTVVIKSLPLPEEVLKDWLKLETDLHGALDMLKSLIPRRQKVWAQIELHLDDFSNPKRINPKTKEIEILKTFDKSGSVKSPYTI